jgi:flavin reductase (DIM6/NTAB) family NADH-FMN oxidoreductase RutF
MIDPEQLPARDLYRFLIGAINPRPIALVSTIGEEGIPNVAPFSFFSPINAKPPLLCFSVISPGGRLKDTLINIRHTKDFVINTVPRSLSDAMDLTATNLPRNQSEFAHAGLTSAPSDVIKAPRVAESPVSFECVLTQEIEIAESDVTVIFGKVVGIHVLPEYLLADGSLNTSKLQLVGALWSNEYTWVGETFQIARPQPPS